MKIQIKKDPHDLETKQGNSQMGSEKQTMANQDEWKLLQHTELENETWAGAFSRTKLVSSNGKQREKHF
jgi:hypothetical protein